VVNLLRWGGVAGVDGAGKKKIKQKHKIQGREGGAKSAVGDVCLREKMQKAWELAVPNHYGRKPAGRSLNEATRREWKEPAAACQPDA